MVTESVLVLPMESITDAVMVWTPSIGSLDTLEPVGEPSWMLEVHTIESIMSPSSGSVAVP